jgi:hypothetical protein
VLTAMIGLTVAGCGGSGNSTAGSAATSVRTAPAITRSTPVALRIPALGMSGSLIAVGLNWDGSVQVPADYRQAGWYQKGPAPGEAGSAVILGHVDSRAGIGGFFYLKDLKAGDTVDVALADGKTAHFTVTAVRMYLKTQFPDRQVFGPRGGSTLQLVTCGGDFDHATGSYRSDVVVYTSLTSTT